jgi:hypothetical protein
MVTVTAGMVSLQVLPALQCFAAVAVLGAGRLTQRGTQVVRAAAATAVPIITLGCILVCPELQIQVAAVAAVLQAAATVAQAL